MAAQPLAQGLCHQRADKEGDGEGWNDYPARHHQDGQSTKVGRLKQNGVLDNWWEHVIQGRFSQCLLAHLPGTGTGAWRTLHDAYVPGIDV